jgi:hypothetical protein
MLSSSSLRTTEPAIQTKRLNRQTFSSPNTHLTATCQCRLSATHTRLASSINAFAYTAALSVLRPSPHCLCMIPCRGVAVPASTRYLGRTRRQVLAKSPDMDQLTNQPHQSPESRVQSPEPKVQTIDALLRHNQQILSHTTLRQ